MEKLQLLAHDPGLHRRRHRPHDRPRRARRVHRRGHHVQPLPRRRRAPARADAAAAGQGVPAARPDRRVVHHRRRPRDAVRVRQPAARRHPGSALAAWTRDRGGSHEHQPDAVRAGDRVRDLHLVHGQVRLAAADARDRGRARSRSPTGSPRRSTGAQELAEAAEARRGRCSPRRAASAAGDRRAGREVARRR